MEVKRSHGHSGRDSSTANSDTLLRWNTAKRLSRGHKYGYHGEDSGNTSVARVSHDKCHGHCCIRPEKREEDSRRPSTGVSGQGIKQQRATETSVNDKGGAQSERQGWGSMASPSASAPGTWPNDATCVEERNQTWPSGSNNNNVISSGDDGDGAGPSVKRFRTRAQELFEEKREARRRRREMKDSGDWLGVQGVNPLTGELDVITPTVTTSSSSRDRRTGNSGGSATAAGGGKGMSSRGSSGSRQGLEDLARAELRARADYAAARARHRGELRADNSRREEAKLEMLERVKSVVRADQLQAVKWRRGERQWSSVAEPTLSPIAGSLQSSAVFGRKFPLGLHASDHAQALVQIPAVLIL